jgi:hypothetical protein
MFSIPSFQRKIFYFLLGIVWFSTGIYYMINDSFYNGLKIVIFGSIFILAIFAVQVYVIKMIQIYDTNLKKQKKR